MAILDWLDQAPPGRIAISGPGGDIDYAGLARAVDATAAWLASRGVVPGCRVGVSLSGGPTRVWINHLAALRAGAMCVSLSDAFAAQLDAIGGVDFVVAHQRDPNLQRFPQTDTLLAFDRDTFASGSGAAATIPVPARPAGMRVMTTSGTTGSPKGVLWNTETIAKRVESTIRNLSLSSETRLFPMLGIDTAGGFRYPLATWQVGGTVLLASVLPDHPSGAAAIERCNLLLTSPSMLRTWLRDAPRRFGGRDERRVVCAGGRLPVRLREQIHETMAARIDIAYGSTEAGSIAMGDASLVDRHPGAVGFALPGVAIEAVDESGEPLAPGLSGRIRVRGQYMVHNYWSQSGAIAADCFREGWFYPGDMGALEPDGLLVIHGRDGDALNLDGKKIELGPIEQAVGELDAVEDCCALAVRTSRGDRLAVAVACPHDTDLEALKRSIRSTLPGIEQFTLVRIPRIPRNAMGKVPRLALARQIEQTAAFRRHDEA